MDGEISFDCACTPTYLCGVASSRKEIIWKLKYTKSPDGGNFLHSDAPQRAISWVKSASNLTISGNTWFQNHRRQQNVSLSFLLSLLIYLRYLSQLRGKFH